MGGGKSEEWPLSIPLHGSLKQIELSIVINRVTVQVS